MSINLVDSIQKNLCFHQLQKIDPNTQEVTRPENLSSEDYLPQAAIPTVLLGLYKFSGNKEGNTAILNDTLSGNLLNKIFGSRENAVVSKVAAYTGTDTEFTTRKMEEIASEAIKVIKQNVPGGGSDNAVRTFLINQRNTILEYLPAQLQIGSIFGDDTIDDRTNKMQGPLSSHMHWIEKFFPSTDRKKEENW